MLFNTVYSTPTAANQTVPEKNKTIFIAIAIVLFFSGIPTSILVLY